MLLTKTKRRVKHEYQPRLRASSRWIRIRSTVAEIRDWMAVKLGCGMECR